MTLTNHRNGRLLFPGMVGNVNSRSPLILVVGSPLSIVVIITFVTKAPVRSVTERDVWDLDPGSIKRSELCQKVVRRRKRLQTTF